MPKMTKTQAKKRLEEARSKINAVFMANIHPRTASLSTGKPVQAADVIAIDKIIDKCLKRLG